ncbi:kinase-like protein [Sanghuangporus baumii]|uniref:Kinase-like protein n=1 Tax=Sanghuangporus baumii TaxID=108892 RepID=A0A9Q5NFA0_SANBA|nr:kinase-like protein [Sanghuangporus baumii]
MATSPQSSPFSTLAFNFANLSTSPQENQVVNLTGYLEEIDGTTFACGGYADLYKYRCRPFIFDPGAENAVFAVKTPRMNEIDSHTTENASRNRNNNPLPSLVSDFMEKGTAVQYLKCCTDANLIELIRDAAKGLSHLHERGIAHGDIKGDNILVGGDCRARIADFGLSRMLGTNGLPVEVTTTDANRSSRWHAVEYFDFTAPVRTTGPTKPADVWSFGCTVLFFSGALPFFDAVEPEVALRLSRGELPKFPPYACNPEFGKHRAGIVAFCRLCWVRDPGLRPQMCVLEEVACSDFWEETCMVGTNQDTVSSEFSRQESSRSDENGESETTPTKPLPEDGLRSRSSSESTVVGTPPEVGDIKIPVVEDPPEETNPVNPPQDTPVDQAEANGENAAPVNSPATIPSPPPPSLEDILSSRHITPQEILNEFAMTTHMFKIQYIDGESTGPSHLRTHVMKCMGKFFSLFPDSLYLSVDLLQLDILSVNGEEYGVGSVPGRKKQAKERAALAALRRLYLENPALFNLRYLPILRAYLDENNLLSRVTWSRQSGPSPDDPTRWEHRATFMYDGNVVAVGVGPTENIAEEHAARKVEAEWSDGIVNAA